MACACCNGSPRGDPLPYPAFAARVLDLYRPPLRRASTFDTMRRVLARLGELPGVATTADLTTATVAAYVATRSATTSVNTVIGELGYLKAAVALAVEEGWTARPPSWRRLRPRAAPLKAKSHHSLAEIARVLGHLGDPGRVASWEGHRLYALASVVAYTGLRRNEALFLTVPDVDLAAGVLGVVARDRVGLKTEDSEQPVPIAAPLAEVLAAWLPRAGDHWLFPGCRRLGPWTGGMPGSKPLDRLKQAGAAVGVLGLTWQSLRHSWATHAESAWGLSGPAIQRVLRHTSPRTQQHYRHADVDNLRGLVKPVSFAGR